MFWYFFSERWQSSLFQVFLKDSAGQRQIISIEIQMDDLSIECAAYSSVKVLSHEMLGRDHCTMGSCPLCQTQA